MMMALTLVVIFAEGKTSFYSPFELKNVQNVRNVKIMNIINEQIKF